MPSAFFAGTTDPVTRKSKTRQWILEFASGLARIQSIRESISVNGKIQAVFKSLKTFSLHNLLTIYKL